MILELDGIARFVQNKKPWKNKFKSLPSKVPSIFSDLWNAREPEQQKKPGIQMCTHKKFCAW